MRQHHVAPFARRLQDGEADLERGHGPGTAVQRCAAMYDGIIEFINDFAARHSGRRQRFEAFLGIAVDGNAARGRLQVGALA